MDLEKLLFDDTFFSQTFPANPQTHALKNNTRAMESGVDCEPQGT